MFALRLTKEMDSAICIFVLVEKKMTLVFMITYIEIDVIEITMLESLH